MEELRNKLPDDKKYIVEELQKYVKDYKSDLKITEAEGRRYIPGFEAETAIYARDEWDGIRDGDVFVASYPKTGTNWTRDTVKRILKIKDPGRLSDPEDFTLRRFANVVERGPALKFEILDTLQPDTRVMCTHMDGETFPVDKANKKGAKIIYVLRNPKDQTVSWYYFANVKSFTFFKEDPRFGEDWNYFTEQYFAGKQPLFTREGEWYPEHILSWYKYKDQENVKFIYYEDMKKDFKREIRNIASFLNVVLTDEEVTSVAHDCSFDIMKKNLDSFRSDVNMLRKGEVGGWKDYFTVAQSEAIDAEFDEKLSNTDIKFTYQL